MEETLKMMKNVIEGYEEAKNIEELILEYQEKQNANVLAYLFVKNYLLINKIANKYLILDNQDVASFSLQELDNAIKKFDFNKQCSFITFFYCCLDNRLKMEVNKLSTASKAANYNLEDLPEYEEIIDKRFTFDNLYDYGLSKELNRICSYLVDGYSCNEIAQMLKVSHTTIHNKLKQIRKVLSN